MEYLGYGLVLLAVCGIIYGAYRKLDRILFESYCPIWTENAKYKPTYEAYKKKNKK